MDKKRSSAGLLLIAFALAPASSLTAAGTSWPMYQGDASHTGYIPVDLNPAVFSLQWQKTVSASGALNPVTAADGKVFASLRSLPSGSPSFFALDAADGAELWSKDFGSVFSVNPPSYGGGKVYIQTGNHGSDTYLRAYDAASGTLVFRSPHAAQWERYLAPTLYAGNAYVNGGYYGGMYGFDGSAGTQLWFKSLPQIDQWTPAVDGRYAYASLSSGKPTLHVINRETGALAFTISDPDFSISSAGSGTAPVLGSMGNALAIVGGRLYNYDVAGRRVGYAVSGSFTGQPSLAGGVVYCLAGGGLSARDEATGNLLWSWNAPAGETLNGTIVVTHSHLFTRTSSTTYAIDLSTHESTWSYPASGHLALGNDSLYIAGATGILTAIALSPTPHPEPPILGAIGDQPVVEGTVLRFTLSSRDPNGDAVTYSIDPLPAGATLNSASGAFSWTPGHYQTGVWPVTFTASDGTLTDSETVQLRVIPVGASAAWPTYQANAAHTGYVPVDLDPANFLPLWQKSIDPAQPLNPVAAADGKVFVSLFSGSLSLFALEATDGTELWSKGFGSGPSVNPPGYADGKVYVQTGNHRDDTYLHAYDAGTGDLVFRSPHSAQWANYYAPTPYAGNIYVNGGYYGGMYGFNGSSGIQLWFAELPQYDQWTPAVDHAYAYAYVGDDAPALYVFDRASGSPAFSIADPNFDWNGWSMNFAPVLGAAGNVLAIHDGRLISFDIANRRIGYEIPAGFTGQPSLAHGVVYCIDAGALSARDEATGNLLWSWEAPTGVTLTGTIVVTHSHLFTRTSTTTYAVDLLTHQSVWSYPASGHLALGNSSLYIADGNGKLTAIALSPVAYPEAPVLTPVGNKSVVEGAPLRFTLSASDPNGDQPTFEAVGPLPAGATLDGATGAFSWTPGYSQAGSHSLAFRATDGGAPPLFSVTETITVTVRNPKGKLFFDNFTDGASPLDWAKVSGRWSGAGGVYTARSLTGTNLTRIVRFEPAMPPLGAGVIRAKLLLTAATGGAAPNGMLVFGYLDAASYRWVKVTGREISLGQTGIIDGIGAGVKKRVARTQTIGRFALFTVKVHADGWVRVYKGTLAAPVLSYRFLATGTPSVAQGGVGLGAVKARTIFDDVTVWEDSALAP